MEGDKKPVVVDENYFISIHSLRMEGDSILVTKWIEKEHFNPLPPHGGRLSLGYSGLYECIISIHSLRMEGDIFKG